MSLIYKRVIRVNIRWTADDGRAHLYARARNDRPPRRGRTPRRAPKNAMPMDLPPRCVAYDDTRTACVMGDADGDVVFRERVEVAASTVGERNQTAASRERSAGAAWTRSCAARSPDGSAVIAVALADASHGRVCASASASGEIAFWRASATAAGESRLETLGAVRVEGGARATSIAFAPAPWTTLTLAAACEDGVIRFYEPRERSTATSWEATREYESAKPFGECTAVAWRRASERVGLVDFPVVAVATSWSKEARHSVSVLAYEETLGRWRVVAELEDGLTTSVRHLAWSATITARGALNLVAASGSKCFVYEFEGVTTSGAGKSTELGRLNHSCEVNSAEWNASGSVIATAAADGAIRFWSANLKDGTWREHNV